MKADAAYSQRCIRAPLLSANIILKCNRSGQTGQADDQNQSWSENELSPNERNPKTVCSNFTSRTNPNEIIWNPENPNEPERKYLFNDFSQFSFAATKHNLLVDITEKLLLKVFIHPWIDWLTVCFILSAIRYPPGDQFIGSGLMEPIFAPLQA